MKTLLTLLVLLLSAREIIAQSFPCLSNQEPAIPAMGANLDGVVDWSYCNAFVDVVRQSRGFSIQSDLNVQTTLDASGWPMTDFALLPISFGNNTAHMFNGTYTLAFTGQATVNYCCAVTNITNVVYDAASNTTTANVVVNAIEPAGGNYFILNFSNTRRTAVSAVNSGLTNIRLIRPGYSLVNTPTFTTDFLDHHRRFGTFRFMDWTGTNNSLVMNWNHRTSPGNPRQVSNTSGVAWEYCIELANTLQKDMWISVPHRANDDYVVQLATLMHNTLDPNLNVYVEYSNELWNGGFDQHIWNFHMANTEVAGGGSNLNNDGATSPYTWEARRIGRRIKEISDIFSTVWGASSINTRVRPVLAYQLVWPGQWVYPALSWLNATYGAPNQYLYGIAGAPYFNLFGGDTTALTSAQVLTLMRSSMEDYFQTTPTHFNWMEAGTAAARWYGLKFMCYEGGPDTFGPNNIQSKKDASFDPGMETLCIDFLNRWYGYGASGLFNWFVAGATSWDSPYGTWGLTNDMAIQNVPKVRAIDNVLAAPAAALIAGFPLSTVTTAIVDTRQYVNRSDGGGYPYDWATLNPYNRYLDGGNFDDYLVRVPQAGEYSLRVNLNCWRAGTQLRISLNNQVVQTIVVPQTTTWGVDNFTLMTPVILPMSEGLNVVRLYYDYTGRSYDTKELQFTFVGSCTALPVELLSFEAALNEHEDVDLYWKAANEINCESYTVEKSSDGAHFSELQKVTARNTALSEYTAHDANPTVGTTYYRLLQKDKDGSASYSAVKSVSLQPLEIGMVYPVPAQEMLTIELLSSEDRDVSLRMMDLAGRTMVEKKLHLKTGANRCTLQLGTLSTALYVLRVSDVNSSVQESKQINVQ